jgi:hypothetical protein
MTFQAAFLKAREAMGLTHYHVTFKEAKDGNYATIDADPENCIATVTFDRERCDLEGCNQSTAVHEALHLALADLLHAIENTPKAEQIEQERLVRRLDELLTRAIFL